MNSMKSGIIVALVVMFLSACSGSSQQDGQAGGEKVTPSLPTVAVISLLYQQQEPGIDPYHNRVLVSDDYIRFDDNAEDSDFVLYDRKAGVIYSVSHDASTILVIKKRVITEKSPLPLKASKQLKSVDNAPAVGGKKAKQLNLYVNKQLCRRQYVVPGLLPKAVRALSEFRTVLAGSLADNIGKTPANLQDPCFLQYEVFAENASLEEGMPIQIWKNDKSRQMLVDYNEQLPVVKSLFSLPKDYRKYSVNSKGVKNP